MLRSRKSNAPGLKALDADKWECGCEVYIWFRPQVGTKEVGCRAANGDDVSIIVIDEIQRGEHRGLFSYQ